MSLGQGVVRRMLSVGATQVLEMVLQLLLPVLLVRVLSPDDFGIYRLVWLVVMTVSLTVPMGMLESLFYFLPRATQQDRLGFIRQTELYLVLSSALAMGALLLARAWLPDSVQQACELGLWLVALASFWLWGSLLDQLPTIEERIRWQTLSSIAMSLLRAAVAVAVAWIWRDVYYLIAALVVVSALKVVLLQVYIWQFHRHQPWTLSRKQAVTQFRYALPVGASGMLFGFRRQAEQWIVAALFTPVQFAAFSVAAILSPLLFMARRSVTYVVLPSLSKRQAQGDMGHVLEVNGKVNLALASVLFPVFAYAFVFADEIITLIYTDAFVAAGDVMRVMILGFMLQVIDLQSLVLLLRESNFSTRLNAGLLVLCVPFSWAGAVLGGLPGAAAGGVIGVLAERLFLASRLSRTLNLPLAHLQPWGSILVQALWCFAVALASGYLVRQAFGFAGVQALWVGATVCTLFLAPPLVWKYVQEQRSQRAA
jgi:O-antigen/teichoic acid export membrane protein